MRSVPQPFTGNSFQNYCTRGGFNWQMNGRPEAQPHVSWCPQFAEYADWYAHGKTLPSQRKI